MRLRLDPWPPEYEAPIQFDEAETPPHAEVDPNVEDIGWQAVRADEPRPPRCVFVDGVRRVEARVLSGSGGILVHGLFGAAATGYVSARPGRAEFGDIRVERFLILGKGEHRRAHIPVGTGAIEFEAHSSPRNTPDAVLGELQNLMRASEARLAESLAKPDVCLFVDGLSYRATGRHEVIGVVKRIVEPYLSSQHFPLVESLNTAERTPLFAITDGKYNRYSCFLRLSEPRPVDHPLAGIVRLEIGAGVGIERAKRLMSAATSALPRFASTPLRDPRAPQNLLPIGTLEQEMKRRLGDPLLIRRAIEKELHEQRNW